MSALTWGLGLLLMTAAGQPPVRLAAPAWRSAGVDAQTGATLSEMFNQQLALQGNFTVLGQAEMAARLGLDGQRRLMACGDQFTGCLDELARRLGVDGVVAGAVTRAGLGYSLDVRIVSTREGRTLGFFSGRAPNELALRDALPEVARRLARDVRQAMQDPFGAPPGAPPSAFPPPPPMPPSMMPPPSPHGLPPPLPPPHGSAVPPAGGVRRASGPEVWVAAVAGGALLVGGGLFYGLALDERGKLDAPGRNYASLEDYREGVARGRRNEQRGLTLAGLGLASGALAAALHFLDGEEAPPTTPALALGTAGSGPAVAVGGSLP